MTAPEPAVSVAVLRETVRARVDATNLRAVAEDVGMSFAWVRNFLAGAEPRSSTVRKLTTWYLRTQAAEGGRIDHATARAALSLLLEAVEPRERARARRAILDALASAAKGGRLPGWVAELRKERG